MITLVLDASAAVDLLLGNNRGQAVATALADPDHVTATVAHLDAEVLSAIARVHRAGEVDEDAVRARLDLLADLDIPRLPITAALLSAAWALRDTIAMRDALYLATAQHLGGKVLTTDDGLRRAAPELTT